MNANAGGRPAGAADVSNRRGLAPWLWLLLGLIAFLFFWPLAMMLVGIFRSSAPGLGGAWTLAPLARTATAPATWIALSNSLVFALLTTTIATSLGAVFAFFAARTTVPLRRLITPVMLLVFAAPNLLYAVSWSLLADPGSGIMNQAVRWATGTTASPFNIFSWTGMVVVQGLKLTAFCYLLLLAPFRNMNRSFEEASLIAGAGRLTTLLRIDLPLLLPAIFGVVIVGMLFGLGAFDIPEILGALAGVPMLSTRIYRTLSVSSPPDYAGASALGLFMMATLALLLVLQWRIVKANRFVTVTGKAFVQEPWDLGPWRHAATAAIVLFAAATLLLPGIQLVLTSFQPAIGVNRYTLSNYASVFADPQTLRAFGVTARLALLSGFAAMTLALVMGQVARSAPRWLQRYLEVGALTPLMMPGVVLAVGLLWAYVSVPGLRMLYGSLSITVIGLTVFVMPIASRVVAGALAQLARDLEESARIAGASAVASVRDIVLPLTWGSFLVGWLVTGVIAAGTLDIPLLLLGSQTPNVAVLVFADMTSGVPTRASALLVLLLVAVFAIAAAGAAVTGLLTQQRVRRRRLMRSHAEPLSRSSHFQGAQA
jgi:iron(III) transport system permease protein